MISPKGRLTGLLQRSGVDALSSSLRTHIWSDFCTLKAADVWILGVHLSSVGLNIREPFTSLRLAKRFEVSRHSYDSYESYDAVAT